MIGRTAGTVALLERSSDRPPPKYHCTIHQESLCGIFFNLQHISISVVKCVNKIRARRLNRRELREYCGLLDMQYGDLILHCEVSRLSRGQVVRRFLELNNIVHDFIEEKDELPEEKIICVLTN